MSYPPNEAQLYELLVETSKEFETMYIVVDALDELKGSEIKVNRRPPFLSKPQKLRTSSQCSISVLVTSRPDFYYIQEYFATSHKLEIKADFSDIEEYARSEMTTTG
ncbi:hypothetical protein OEA41_000125 [Lepraria neglecta]|uniref:Nephrocystin 3-like N-terminal domain-containing protein n=1 Tax=Lepraria neglecta TaxID=209136 RepID=A0AAD9ZG21_9LECA|nr:hypothetical protein OEA41_000125 [Lepraria neglecta]